jgi:NAD(P)H-dependent flavin oxidoreductase YrpB (nitropropane dioxygenase family)
VQLNKALLEENHALTQQLEMGKVQLAEARDEDMVEFTSVAGLPARALGTPWLRNYLKIEMRLQAEMEELKEDLEVVKQNEFGRKIFEAFAETYGSSYVDEDAVQSKLAIAEAKLAEAEEALAEREEEVAKMVREAKMEQVLSPLTGKKREQMAMVLKNIETGRLEESYKFFIGRVLKEEAAPLTESAAAQKTTVVTGEPAATIVESAQGSKAFNLAEIRRLAGIK